VREAGDAEQCQQRGGEVGDERGLTRLDAELAEAVGGQQQATQRLALEDGLPVGGGVGELLLQAGQCRIVGLLGGGDLVAQVGLHVAELGVRLTTGDRLEMQADEFVGVAFGLLAGGELLAGVGDQAGGLLLRGGEGVGGLEGDVLLAERPLPTT
jgi:hypothetical protein